MIFRLTSEVESLCSVREKEAKALISLAQIKVFPHEISPLQLSTASLSLSGNPPVVRQQLQRFISSIRIESDIT